MFKNMWNNFYNTMVRAIDPRVRAVIIIAILVLALVCFIFSFHKKDSVLISNWFLFYVAIALTILGVVYSCL